MGRNLSLEDYRKKQEKLSLKAKKVLKQEVDDIYSVVEAGMTVLKSKKDKSFSMIVGPAKSRNLQEYEEMSKSSDKDVREAVEEVEHFLRG